MSNPFKSVKQLKEDFKHTIVEDLKSKIEFNNKSGLKRVYYKARKLNSELRSYLTDAGYTLVEEGAYTQVSW